MNFIFGLNQAKLEVKAEKHAKSYLYNIVRFCQFLGFYSIFCLGRTKNEVHISSLHSKMQLLMYGKGGVLNQKKIISRRRWIEDNQEARTGGKH